MSKKLKSSNEKEILLKKVTTNPATPIVEKGVYSFKAEFMSQEATVEGTPIYVFHAGYKVIIPEGCIGIFLADESVASSSLISATGPRIIPAGEETDLFVAFKLTTVSSPALFKAHQYEKEDKKDEEGAVFAKLIIMNVENMGCHVVEEAKEEAAKVEEDEQPVKAAEEMYSVSDAEFEDVPVANG